MRFTLIYDAAIPVASKVSQVTEKHNLRRITNVQLRNLAELAPLKYYNFLDEPGRPGIVRPFTEEPDPLDDDPNKVPNPISTIGGDRFAALICQSMGLYAELDIMFYLPGKDFGSLHTAGDIDNRAKTLLDGLRIPRNKQEIPKNWAKEKNDSEDPLFVLLQDDTSVTKLSVCVEPRLEKPEKEDIVLALISVVVRARIGTRYNLGLIG